MPAAGRATVLPPAGRGRRERGAIALGLLLLLLPGLIAVGGPLIWRHDPLRLEVTARLRGPSPAHPLGTDSLGRDVLARVLGGGRLSLGVSLLVTAITAATGIALGCLAASRGGLIDLGLTRLVDILLGFPFLLLALAVAGLAGGGVAGIVLALGLFGWGTYARLARAETLRIAALPFVDAARSLGARDRRVLARHVLPALAPALLVVAVVRFGQTILTIAGLSFLGVGVQPPTPEWGSLLFESLPFLERAPHVWLAPGLAVTLACLLISVGAELLRQALDPALG